MGHSFVYKMRNNLKLAADSEANRLYIMPEEQDTFGWELVCPGCHNTDVPRNNNLG